jgi:hypothetical protein
MKNRIVSGILFFILGLLVAIGPITIVPVCGIHSSMHGEESGMKMESDKMQTETSATSSYMKCHWTARAELGVGLVIVTLGILLIFVSKRLIRLGISLAIGINGVLALLIPTRLIGVCASKKMACHELTLPTLVILSSFIVVISIANVAFLYQGYRKGTVKYETQAVNN